MLATYTLLARGGNHGVSLDMAPSIFPPFSFFVSVPLNLEYGGEGGSVRGTEHAGRLAMLCIRNAIRPGLNLLLVS